MKKLFMILPLALILCFMVGCQNKEAMAELEEFRAQAAVEEQNEEIAERYGEAWNNGDWEALSELLDPEFVFHSGQGTDVSKEADIETAKNVKSMFPNRNVTAEDVFAKGDKVIVRYIFRGTHEGDIEGFPATGNQVEVLGIMISRIENGKIVESWGASDQLYVMQQLGMELKPKEGEK